jgi:FtsH-binding integral membrane protein
LGAAVQTMALVSSEGNQRQLVDGINDNQNLQGLNDPQVRAGFVRKVYGILSVQLVLTVAIAAPIMIFGQEWIDLNEQYASAAIIISLVVVMCMSCFCMDMARVYPQNYLFLAIVTVCEAVVVGFISAMYELPSVCIAAGLTSGIFFGLTAFACTTKRDFTGMGSYLMSALMGLIFTSFLCMFFPSAIGHTLVAGAGAILFSCYIVYDTQLIVGGKSDSKFTVDDYVFAAFKIYMDIIRLFLYLLRLFGERRQR